MAKASEWALVEMAYDAEVEEKILRSIDRIQVDGKQLHVWRPVFEADK